MAISYTIPNSFAALTLIESAKVNQNETYTKDIFDGIEALTKTLAKLKVDADPATALEVATKQYVDHYSTLRRPNLQWASVTTVAVESGLDGTSGNIPMLFPDGSVRTETSTTRTTFNITRNAVLVTSGAQSGLRTSLSETANTFYALYAVKVTDSSTLWCTVGDTVLPTQTNYATLNSSFGTSGWVYLGMIRNGDNDGATLDILKFVQSANYTQLYNNASSGAGITPRGSNLASSGSTTQLTYTYSAGTGTTNIPNHFLFTEYALEHGNTANDTYIGNASDSYQIWRVVSTGRVGNTVRLPSVDGANIKLNTTASTARIWLVGWVDGVLGVGANPLL